MCGFTLHIFNQSELTNEMIQCCINDSLKISHRGPDSMRVEVIPKIGAVIVFYRLSVNDTSILGNQPFIKVHENSDYYLICNGEVYNHKILEDRHQYSINSRSDCEFILNELIETDMKPETDKFNSEHAFVGIRINSDNSYNLVASNDRFGIRPLFQSSFFINGIKGIGFSSEMQGLSQLPDFQCSRFNSSTNFFMFHSSENSEEKYEKYYDVRSILVKSKEEITFEEAVIGVKDKLEESIRKRLMSDRPYGFFLSGGLDSTAICVFAAKILGPGIKTFSIGFPGSEDEIYARRVSKELKTDHTHFTLSKDRYLDLIDEVIKCTGSFDTTTIRASIGQYECSRLCREKGMIVMLSGDGSDELFFSYDDSKYCPDYESFLDRNYHLLENIHTSDGIRADRCVSRFGMELRLPFLDYEFVDYILSLPVEYRFTKDDITKPLLREALRGYISDDIINRPKVTFSDGVGSKEDQSKTLITTYFSNMYTKNEFEKLKSKYEYHCSPDTNENLYIREIFTEYFGDNESLARTIPHYWRTIFKKSDDPSAWYTEDLDNLNNLETPEEDINSYQNLGTIEKLENKFVYRKDDISDSLEFFHDEPNEEQIELLSEKINIIH